MQKDKVNTAAQAEGGLGNDYATGTVPLSKRRGFSATASVWVGWCISLSAFLTGGTIGAGNTLGFLRQTLFLLKFQYQRHQFS